MRFYFLLFMVFFAFCESKAGIEDILACQERASGTKLILGNTRSKGGVLGDLAGVFGMDAADFTHQRSFKGEGKIVSVDLIQAAKVDGKKIKHHIQCDLLTVDMPVALKRFGVPTTAYFEWVPSVSDDPSNPPAMPILLPTLEKMFHVLAPGGTVIIDHFAYSFYLPGKFPDALKKLREYGVDMEYMRRHVNPSITPFLPNVPDGKVSEALQNADPFTLHMSMRERLDLTQLFMCEDMKQKDPTANPITQYMDAQTNPDAAVTAAHKTAEVLNKGYDEIVMYLKDQVRKKISADTIRDTFEYFYYMASRGSKVVKMMEKIGYEAVSGPHYFDVNPFNGRRHAHLFYGRIPTSDLE